MDGFHNATALGMAFQLFFGNQLNGSNGIYNFAALHVLNGIRSAARMDTVKPVPGILCNVICKHAGGVDDHLWINGATVGMNGLNGSILYIHTGNHSVQRHFCAVLCRVFRVSNG